MSGPALDRLDHLVLTVRDVDATCAFYTGVLGMRVATFGEGRTEGPARLVAARPTPGSADLPIGRWVTHLADRGVTIIDGPSRRAGAEGPIESVYVRDPHGNLVEVSNAVERGDPIAPLRRGLVELQTCVRAVDGERGRALYVPEFVAFATVDEAAGAIDGRFGGVAAPWDSLGRRPGTTVPRPGRATVTFVHRAGRWLATHSHFSLSPSR